MKFILNSCASLLGLLIATTGMAQTYRFSGTVTYATLPGTSSEASRSVDFQVRSSATNRQWEILTKDRSRKYPTIRYLFTGEKLFCERDTTEMLLPETIQKTTGPRINKTYKILNTNTIPPFWVDLCFPLWLGFCSMDHFDNKTIPDFSSMGPNIMLPTDDPLLSFDMTTHASGTSRLPERVVFRSPGAYITREIEESPNVHRWRPPFDHGFVCAKYSAQNWSTLGAADYPKKAVLDVFGPKPEGKTTNDVRLTTRTTILIHEAIEEKNPIETLPEISKNPKARAVVTDYTIRTIYNTPISYHTSTNFVGEDSPLLPEIIETSSRIAELRGGQPEEKKVEPERRP